MLADEILGKRFFDFLFSNDRALPAELPAARLGRIDLPERAIALQGRDTGRRPGFSLLLPVAGSGPPQFSDLMNGTADRNCPLRRSSV